MMSHIAADAFDPGVPSSLSPKAYASLRTDAGFEGLAVTDAQDMGAITSEYGSGGAAVTALAAGADVLLMPLDLRAAHTAVVTALGDGTLPRERVEDAAAKVVAVQTWQARVAGEVPVPPDATARAEAASRALSAAALTIVDGTCTVPGLDGAVRVSGRHRDRPGAVRSPRPSGRGCRRAPGRWSGWWAGSAGGGGAASLVVSLDAPYPLEQARGDVATLALFGRTDAAFDALVAVLTGAATPQGALPVSIGRTTSTVC